MFSWPPITRINYQVTNRPCLVIDDKIIDVANLTIFSLDMMTAHIMRTAQIGIPPLLRSDGFLLAFRVSHEVRAGTPWVTAVPIRWPPIISVVCLFELSRNRLVSL